MKKFKFSLDKVLSQRHIQVDLRKKEFADAEKEFDQETQKLNLFIQQKADAVLQRYSIVSGSGSWTAQVEQINSFVTGQDLRIKKQNERLLELKKRVESRREILQQALTEAKIIEKLKEKRKAEFFKEALQKEQAEMDELSVIRFSKIEN